MENCLVKQLYVRVNDDTFPYLDKVVMPYSSLKNATFTIGSLQVNAKILTDTNPGAGPRTYSKFIPVSIGDKFTFEGIADVYGKNKINVRIVAFDNVDNFETFDEYLNSGNNIYLLNTSLYNYTNWSKRTFEVPNTEDLQNAQNLCIGVTFLTDANFDGNIEEETITMQYNYE